MENLSKKCPLVIDFQGRRMMLCEEGLDGKAPNEDMLCFTRAHISCPSYVAYLDDRGGLTGEKAEVMIGNKSIGEAFFKIIE